MIHSKLKKLHEFAIDLRRIGMYQTAGDIDYLVSWLVSPEFNNGTHLKPHPAGKNTIDPYSNNCPIPFTANLDLIRKCTSLIEAKSIVGEISTILNYLKTVFTSNVEDTAISSYISYNDKLYEMLGGEPGPTPPGPEPPTPVVEVYDYGYMSDDEDFYFMSPRGFIDTSTMELIYGGGEPLYMIEGV